MKLLSEATESALRAVVWLAAHPDQTWTVRQIAQGTKSKPGYLVRVLQSLARAGIVSAQRGVGGGIKLSASPDKTTILDVVNAVDPLARITTCPLGLTGHGTRLCTLHRRVDQAMAHLQATFAAVTIADLLDDDATASKPLCDTATNLVKMTRR